MWPKTYAYEHSKDHDLANAVSAGLEGIEFQDIYVLRMPALKGGSKQELNRVGRAVAQEIRLRYASLRPGQILRIRCNGHLFKFGVQPIEERDDDGLSRGLCFSWTLGDCWPQCADLQEELRPQILKIFEACGRKFAGYASDRRILMLDPHGDVAFNSVRWWSELFIKCQPPSVIDEIWIASSGDNEFGEEEWSIEKVFGGDLALLETVLGLHEHLPEADDH
jgi:hypothetical protein